MYLLVAQDGVIQGTKILVPWLCDCPQISVDGSLLPASLRVASPFWARLSIVRTSWCYSWTPWRSLMAWAHIGRSSRHFLITLTCFRSWLYVLSIGPIIRLKFRPRALPFRLVLHHLIRYLTKSAFEEVSFSKCDERCCTSFP